MKDLKQLDQRLGCHYEQGHEHFVVTFQRVTGDPVPLFAVKGEHGEFRQPDRRDIERLKESDVQRESPQHRIQRVSKYMDDVREADRRRAKDDIRNMTKDNRIQLQNVLNRAAKNSKGNSQFRRINVKPKGKVFH